MKKRRTRIQKLERQNRQLRERQNEAFQLVAILNDIAKLQESHISSQGDKIIVLQSEVAELRSRVNVNKQRIVNLETLINVVTKRVIGMEVRTGVVAWLRRLLSQRTQRKKEAVY